MAEEIIKKKAGIIVDTNPDSIATAVTNFLLNIEKTKVYRKNARKLSEDYDWENILDSALCKSNEY